MKKIISIVLVILLIALFPIAAFAEDTKTSLTPGQKAARQAFLQDYYDKMAKLTELRAQTYKARQENKTLEEEIKEKLKGLYGTLNKEQVDQVKTIVQQNKDLETQAKALNQNRKSLVSQFKTAVKDRDTGKAADLKSQILDLTKQIEDLRAKVAANRTTIEPLKSQIKTSKDEIKALKDKVKSLQDQNKQLIQKINQEEKAKQELWTTYRSQIQSKDYTAAGKTLDQILTAKANILTDINTRTDVLKQILAAISK